MATSRIKGTNEIIKTYGGAGLGRDYTALSTWEADTDTDHVTDAETDVLECYDDAANFNDAADLSGSTNNSTYFRIIRPAFGEGHDGTTAIGVYFLRTSVGNGRIFLITETNSSIQDLLLTISSNSASTFSCGETATGANDSSFIACIVYDGVNSGSGGVRGVQHKGSNAILALCMIHNNDDHGIEGKDNTVYAYNCVSTDNAKRGYNHSSGTFVTKNCIGDGNTTEDWDTAGTWTGSTTNASGDTSAQGTSARTSQTFTFKDSANDDFRLKNTDAGARDFGTDLSADATFAFDDDINRKRFKVWDIGFHDSEAQRRRVVIS